MKHEQELSQLKVLVVDDTSGNRQMLQSFLRKLGCQSTTAEDGAQAVEACRREMPDLILMDVMMPVMDGLTATREIRRRPEWKKMPVIALTAKAMPDDRQKCVEAGANDYIAKPLDVDKLVSLVKVWLPK